MAMSGESGGYRYKARCVEGHLGSAAHQPICLNFDPLPVTDDSCHWLSSPTVSAFVRVMPMYSSELELWLLAGLMDLRRKKPALVRERAQVEGVKHLIRDHSTAAAQQGKQTDAAEQGGGRFGNLGEREGAVAAIGHISRCVATSPTEEQ